MITREEFQIMQTTARCLIEVVFAREEQFKQQFITPCCKYRESEYNLFNAHISGYRLKTVLEFEDGSKADVITDLTEVIEWFYDMTEENKNV